MVNQPAVSVFRIFVTLVLGVAIGSAVGMILSFPLFKLDALLQAPAAFFMGPFYSLPAILVCFSVYLYLDRLGARAMHHYAFVSAFLGIFYGLVYCFFKTYGFALMMPFVIGGVFTGWFYWRETYSTQMRYRIFKPL